MTGTRIARFLVPVVAVALLLTACAARPDGGKRMPDADPVPAGSVVGFYGDSLTFGLGATSPDQRWATLLCARRGWSEVNPSVSGLGFVHARADLDLPGEIIAAHPDLVIVALGHNDVLLVDQRGPEIRSAIEADLGRLRTELPDARIVVLALFSPLSSELSQVASLNGWLKESADAVDAVFVPKSSRWLAGRSDWTVDGIHFNDAGNAAVAELLDDELSRVL